MLESESEAMAGCLQPRCAVDEKDRVINEMFPAKFQRNISVSAYVLVG
jgi:hypothetical protein